MMKRLHIFLIAVIALYGCSDFDDQEFTVLLPSAGEDQVIFTSETGTTIQLNGGQSTDVNKLGFDIHWELDESPEGSSVTLNDVNSLTPTFEVTDETAGRFVWRLIISRDDQISQDITRVDVNPAITQVLLFNAVDGEETASLNIKAVEISGGSVVSGTADETYYNVDLNIAKNTSGAVTMEVLYGDKTLLLDASLEALKSYTLYVVGTSASPELLLVEKTLNQNTLPSATVGLDAIVLSAGIDNVEFFIDATSIGFGVLPLNNLLAGIGLPDTFGLLNYQGNKEIVLPSQSIIPLPIWATVNGQRISNDTNIALPAGVEGNFGTFILVPDASKEFGNTLLFLNNSDLLPQ